MGRRPRGQRLDPKKRVSSSTISPLLGPTAVPLQRDSFEFKIGFKLVISVTENRTFILLGEPPTGGVAVSSPIECVADGERPNLSKSAYSSAGILFFFLKSWKLRVR